MTKKKTKVPMEAPGARPTLMAVARRAGVAPDTARRAILGASSVRSYLRERVLAAARELDYSPNLVARALKGQSLRMVTIAAPEFGQLYFARLAHDLSERLIDIGMEPTLCFDVDHAESVARSFSTCASILVTGASEESIRRLAERQRVVTINPDATDLPPGAASVSCDFPDAYRRLILAMHARGRRRIAVLSSHYLRCLANGWPAHKMPHVFATRDGLGLPAVGPEGRAEPVFSTVDEFIVHLARHPGSVDAVVCENDLSAAALVAALAPLGLLPPRDVPVAGCDDNFRVAGTWTLRIDTAAIAAAVVRLLQGLLAGDTPSEPPLRLVLLDESGKEIP